MEVVEHSALTVVSALFNGIGVTVGINLPLKVSIEAGEGKVFNNRNESHELITMIAKEENMDARSFNFSINSEIPPGVGLKSSSAVSLAILRALRQYSGSNKSIMQTIVDSCVYSKKYGISYTGAMDDAISCHFGGLNFVNNERFEIVDRFSISKNKVYISIPNTRKRNAELDEFRTQQFLGKIALKYAFDLNLKKAALENSRAVSNVYGYDFSIIETLSSIPGVKIAGFTGTGPSFYAIADSIDEENQSYIASFFKQNGNYILTELR